ncbi:hypothetical protein MCEMRE196_01056 [Candidatus Nanopelagicaceae bacterium]
MNILKRYESDDFDESYAFDDAEYGDIEESGSSKSFLVKAIAMILAVTGIAYGANIALTPSGSSVEFGQGFQTYSACDTQDNGITVIPYSGFINDSGSGKFSLDSIILENIDKKCIGSDFIIQVWGETGTALNVSETATAPNGGAYKQYDVAKFWFKDSATVVNLDMSYIDFEPLHDSSISTEVDANQSSILITFDPDQTLSFADSTAIRKITIQTVKHS